MRTFAKVGIGSVVLTLIASIVGDLVGKGPNDAVRIVGEWVDYLSDVEITIDDPSTTESRNRTRDVQWRER